MTVSATVKSIVFSDGTTIELTSNDIVVIVGPNNVGKSAALRNIYSKAQHHGATTDVVTELSLNKEGEKEELLSWLKKENHTQLGADGRLHFHKAGRSVHESNVEHFWNIELPDLNELVYFFFYHDKADTRLQASGPAPGVAVGREPLTHPIHYLYRNDVLESRISNQFHMAFDKDLVVHKAAGSQIPLYCGDSPQLKEGEDRTSLSYVERLEALDKLEEQGDGMRSFVGTLLYTTASSYQVVLMDEPEAFLHPPQARLLGKMLADNKPEHHQLFLATHNGDFLRGLLDSANTNVRVVRIQRRGEINPIRELSPEAIRQLWSDPLLRYSNVLDGIFHHTVVLCEADADCRFYAAVLDALSEGQPERVRPDAMFIHCGGKARMPVVVNSLRSLDVPLRVVADFDVLNDQQPLRSIYEGLGGDWGSIERDWRQVKTAIDERKPELETEAVKEDINQVLGGVDDRVFPKEASAQINKILRRSSPWSLAKDVGTRFVPPGQQTETCERLLATLRDVGFFVVHVGELEGFDRSVGNHGPKWVNEVLQKNLREDRHLEEARNFVGELV